MVGAARVKGEREAKQARLEERERDRVRLKDGEIERERGGDVPECVWSDGWEGRRGLRESGEWRGTAESRFEGERRRRLRGGGEREGNGEGGDSGGEREKTESERE